MFRASQISVCTWRHWYCVGCLLGFSWRENMTSKLVKEIRVVFSYSLFYVSVFACCNNGGIIWCGFIVVVQYAGIYGKWFVRLYIFRKIYFKGPFICFLYFLYPDTNFIIVKLSCVFSKSLLKLNIVYFVQIPSTCMPFIWDGCLSWMFLLFFISTCLILS